MPNDQNDDDDSGSLMHVLKYKVSVYLWVLLALIGAAFALGKFV